MQGEQVADAPGPKLPAVLQAKVFKGKTMGKGCRVCDQLLPTFLNGQ